MPATGAAACDVVVWNIACDCQAGRICPHCVGGGCGQAGRAGQAGREGEASGSGTPLTIAGTFAGATIAEQAANVLAGKLLPPPYRSPVPATGLSTWLGMRCLALPLHLTVRQLMPIEMLVLGGSYAGVAVESLPKLWVLVVSLVAGAIVSTVHPPYTETLFLMIYSAWPLVFLYAWESAGRRRRARTGAKHRHPSASTTGSSPAIP